MNTRTGELYDLTTGEGLQAALEALRAGDAVVPVSAETAESLEVLAVSLRERIETAVAEALAASRATRPR